MDVLNNLCHDYFYEHTCLKLLTAAAESWAEARQRAKDLFGQCGLTMLFKTTKSLAPKDSAG